MFFKEGILAYDLMYYHIDLDDNLLRMLAITISINENRIYDFNYQLKKNILIVLCLGKKMIIINKKVNGKNIIKLLFQIGLMLKMIRDLKNLILE